MNQQEIKPTDEQVVQAFVNDEQYKENHKNAALQLQKIFGKKYFTIADLLKQTRISNKSEAEQLLVGLQLFGLVHSKQGGQLYKNQIKFQLMISSEDKLKVLKEEKERAETQLSLINQEIEKVEQEIKQSSTIEE